MEKDVDVDFESNSTDSEETSSDESEALAVEMIAHSTGSSQVMPQLKEKPRTRESVTGEGRGTSKVEREVLDRDIQGIDWSTIRRSKKDARAQRLDIYENYLNVPDNYYEAWPKLVEEEGKDIYTGGHFFRFHKFTRSADLTILHFQLRNLLWATSSYKFYFLSHNSIMMFNSLNQATEEIMDLATAQPMKASNLGGIMVSTICVSHGLMAAGGFHGELVVVDFEGDVLFSKLLTSMESGITNGIDIFEGPNSVQLVAANNDNMVRLFDCSRFDACSAFSVPWPANWASPSPTGGKMLAVVGDDCKGLVLDSVSGQQVGEFSGHLDFSFAAAWHPSGTFFATGNQDTSTRVWDVRNLSKSLHMLPGRMSAVRSLRYSPCGRFLAAAEAADYVRIYDSASDYARSQEVEFFSEVSGITFTPDGSSFVIGLQDMRWGGLMEFQRGCFEGRGLQGTWSPQAPPPSAAEMQLD